MLSALLWCLMGLVVLVAGAEILVRSGTRVAARLGISPVVIGLTVVAIGTSTPELAVGIDAAMQGAGDLAVGNIAGTNVVNILLIFGLSALLAPMALRMETLKFDLPMMALASLLLLVLAWDRSLTRLDGAILLAIAVPYSWGLIRLARREAPSVQSTFAESFPAPFGSRLLGALGADIVQLIVGIAVLIISADWLVDGAVSLARLWHVSDAFIGLTIIAIGTSAPELVTTVISTLRNQRDIAIGNLLGSSVYNITIILGITCSISANPIVVGDDLIKVDIPVMAGVAMLCIPVFFSGRIVSRREGGLFILIYLAYLSYLVINRT